MSRRLVLDRLDHLDTSTLNWHQRRMFNAIFYQSEFRTGRFGEPGPGVILDETGIHIHDSFGIEVTFFDLSGNLWILKAGVLTQVQTFNDGSGHNILFV